MPTDDDLNPSRPTPPGTPDRRYVDRRPSPRGSERIPSTELAELIDEFSAHEWPERKKRKRAPETPPEPDTTGDDYDRGDQ